jgi:hypothetical protein
MKPFFRKPSRRARSESRPTALRLALTTTLRKKEDPAIRRRDLSQSADRADAERA